MDAQEKALNALSLARTALSDPSGLPDEEFTTEAGDVVKTVSRLMAYAIDKIDYAMGEMADDDEPKFALAVCRDGVCNSRMFDPEDEGIDALGEAINAKTKYPESVITIVVGRVDP